MDVDEDGNILKKQELINEEGKAIRDVSRNRLQRLGALYSETENLSSPIHRTEAKFCAESSSSEALCDRETPRPAKNKSSKLAALADSINKWECDVSAENKKPTTTAINKAKPGTSSASSSAMRTPTKATTYKTTTQTVLKTPERKPQQNNQNSSPTVVGAQSKGAIKKTTFGAASTAGSSTATGTSPKPKSLKWDKSVMDALESQGFQKRQSQGGSVTLSYNKDPAHDSSSDREKENRMNETVSNKKMALSSNKDLGMKNSPKKLNLGTAPGTPKVGNNSRQSIAANRKDPAELSLRDRLAIFEKNKGEAVMPKAPLAQPIPANKANPGSNNLSGRCGGHGGGYGGPAPPAAKTPEKKQMVPVNLPKATSDAQGQGIQSTISALMQGGATISGQAIKESVKKQRAQEMDVLLNRFNNRQQVEETTEDDEEQVDDDCDSSEVEYKIPAPPPPPPAHYSAGGSHKRRSGDKKEEGQKRVKTQAVQHNRLYPQLSDVDDTSSSEQNYTTATVSEDNNKDEDYDYR